MSKPAIPTVRTGQHALDLALSSVKQTLDEMTGQARGSAGPLQPLPESATLADVVARVNELTERMQ